MSLRVQSAALAACLALVACGDDDGSTGTADAGVDTQTQSDAGADAGADAATDAATDPGVDTSPDAPPAVEYPDDPPDIIGGDRPAAVIRPAAYDPAEAWPVVLLLHGYGASGLIEDVYLGASAEGDALGFITVRPDGTVGQGGSRYWNATDACCAFGQSDVDDVAYLTGLIDELAQTHHVDPSRVHVFGHSNGGFMALRLACEAPAMFASVASLAGAAELDPADCPAAGTAVSVLQIHGTADETILYNGGRNGSAGYPSAQQTVETMAARAGCDVGVVDQGPALDLETSIAGDDTREDTWQTGCRDGALVTLWTIDGGGHIPALSGQGTPQIISWLLAHGR